MTAGYMVYSRYWETGCLPVEIKKVWIKDRLTKIVSVAICGFPDQKFTNGVAFVFPTRKAASRAVTRAMKAGYFGPRDHWQIIRLVK